MSGSFRRSSQGSGGRPDFRGGPPGGRTSDDPFNEEIKAALGATTSITYRAGQHVRPDLLDKEAQSAAKALANITTTQLRRFFEQTGSIKRRDELQNLTDSEVLAQVAFLKASAAYGAMRQKNRALVDFIVLHANSITSRQDFLDFHWHFEAVIAFHKVYAIDRKGN